MKLFAALLFAALAAAPPAQTVRVENLGSAFHGWVRTTIDVLPPMATGTAGGVQFAVGRLVGRDVHVVDLLVDLPAGGTAAIDLASAKASSWSRPPLPADPLGWTGGPLNVAGTPLQWVSLQPDGAAWLMHLRGRTGRMLVVDAWVLVYPGQAWSPGEVLVTCSNPAVPDMGEDVAALSLAFGSALVLVPGHAPGDPLVAAGTHFGDGQARLLPVTFAWPSHIGSVLDWSSVSTQAQLGVAAVGIRRLLHGGNPHYPAGFSARSWAAGKFGEAVRRLHTWDGAVAGPNKNSGDTGAQEDQVFVRGEPLLDGGVPAVTVTYLAAAKLANRPCNHREADGTLLDPARHVSPRLVMWDGRAHWHTGVSPDQLGKPRGLTHAEASDWWGPDVEHAFCFTLLDACRETGSPGLQEVLKPWASIYQLQWTTAPGLSTTQPYAARAVGWEGLLAEGLFDMLEDRALAAGVADHWCQRWDLVLGPRLTGLDVWDVRTNDPRLGAGPWWMPWQQGVGAFGLEVAGSRFGRPAARDVALHAADVVLQQAWVQVGTRWQTCYSLPVGGTAPSSDTWDYFGCGLAPQVVMRHNAGAERAAAVMAQLLGEASLTSQFCWLSPEAFQ